MAVKGKKKSQTRGSQGRRRPAAAPRPSITARTHIPWYRTAGGRVGIAVGVVGLIAAVAAGVVAARTDPGLEARQERLEGYTERVSALGGDLAPVAGEMKAAPAGVDAAGLERLKKSTKRWIGALAAAQGDVADLRPPASLDGTNPLFAQAVQLYSAAAEQYDLAVRAPQELQAEILARAGALRDQAASLWTIALNQIEGERAEAELGPAGLQPPAAPGPVTPGSLPGQPQPSGPDDKRKNQKDDGGKSGRGGGGKDNGGGAGKND
jgi:hypothetical protein